MEAVGSWIKPGIDRNWSLPQPLTEGFDCGCVVDQATSTEIFKNVGGTHRGSLSPVLAP